MREQSSREAQPSLPNSHRTLSEGPIGPEPEGGAADPRPEAFNADLNIPLEAQMSPVTPTEEPLSPDEDGLRGIVAPMLMIISL